MREKTDSLPGTATTIGNRLPGKQSFSHRVFVTTVLTTVLLVTCFSPLACNQAQPVPKTPQLLGLIQQNDRISVSLSGLMKLNRLGNNETDYLTFGVTNIPISWNDTTFSADYSEYPSANESISYYVHGIVTADGTWIEHVSFARLIIEGQTPGPGFDVTLNAIPIIATNGGNVTDIGFFETTGDVQKHVLLVDYSEEGVSYISTDWQNLEQPPVIKLNFSRQSPGTPATPAVP